MMKVTLAAALLTATLKLTGQSNCVLKKDAEGIKVYTCSSQTEKLKSLRAEFALENTTLHELEAFLMRVENYVNWQYHVIEANLLKKINENEMIYRTEVSTPWPVAGREMIVWFKKKKDLSHGRMDIVINSVTHEYPENESTVRVPSSVATWTVQAATRGSLRIVYTLRIDPGGLVPVWLVNTALAEGPFETFRNLKKQLE